MKTTSDSIFQLVKRLDAFEKRYIRQHLDGDGDSIYRKAFDQMDKMQAYDEEKLLQKIGNPKSFTTLKNQLKHSILEALVIAHRDKDTRSKILWSIDKARWLGEKGGEKEALKRLKKIREECEADFRWTYALQALQEEKWLSMGAGIERNEEIRRKELDLMRKQESDSAYYMLVRRIMDFRYRKERSRNEAQQAELDSIMDSEYLKDDTKASTPVSRYFYHTIFGIYYSILSDDAESLESYRAALQVYSDFPRMRANRPLDYFLRLNSFASKLSIHGLTAELRDIIQSIRMFAGSSEARGIKNVQAQAFIYCFTHEAQALGFERDWKKSLELVRSVEEEYEPHLEGVNDHHASVFLYRCMIVCFWSKDYDECLDWILALRQKPEESMPIGHIVAAILEILCHIFLDNLELAENLMRNRERSWNKKDQLYPAEKFLLSSFRKMVSKPKGEWSGYLKSLQPEIRSWRDDSKQAVLLQYFEFDEWAEGM